ncbi:hypothetical protein MTR67_039663 [Solanum verrucosum]|uniref:Uncharacterized protein n=1 Tax=Solanum verrucosum TaxID=315347 RepID=A0AAF0ZQL9_SOLVR|nr:hypothetical protein MTR67_039663 [Solanum verrucosum]
MEICAAADHSASLVGIADELGDSPFGVVHRRLAPYFSILVLWVVGQDGTASWNFSAMRRLLLFFRRLDPFLQGSAYWNKRQTDHSASLVGIADELSDSPFGVVHRRLAPSFSILVLWVVGQHGTASWNFSAMRRLLLFFHRLDPFLQGSAYWNKRQTDNSASLVGIADELGDSPLGVVHRRLAPYFSILVLWVVGQDGTASWNFSAMRRLLLFFRRLDPFLQGSAYWNKRQSKIFR